MKTKEHGTFVNYNAYLPTAKDIALKDEPKKNIQRKRKDIERDYALYSFMHKDKGFNQPFANIGR